jgi:hypothetical protein
MSPDIYTLVSEQPWTQQVTVRAEPTAEEPTVRLDVGDVTVWLSDPRVTRLIDNLTAARADARLMHDEFVLLSSSVDREGRVGFWSSDCGWVNEVERADIYTKWGVEQVTLPVAGKWITKTEALTLEGGSQ